MKDDCTTNSHYLMHTFVFENVGRMHFLNLGVKGLTLSRHFNMYVYVCVYVYICICMCVFVFMCVHIYIYIYYIYTYTYICVCVCVFVYVYTRLLFLGMAQPNCTLFAVVPNGLPLQRICDRGKFPGMASVCAGDFLCGGRTGLTLLQGNRKVNTRTYSLPRIALKVTNPNVHFRALMSHCYC